MPDIISKLDILTTEYFVRSDYMPSTEGHLHVFAEGAMEN